MPQHNSPFKDGILMGKNALAAPLPDDAGSIRFVNPMLNAAQSSEFPMPKKRIYISGKISGLHPDDYTKYFTMAEAHLIGQGWEVVNPLAIDQGEDPTWEDCLVNDIRQLFRCDAIYMLGNWPTSRGARIERSIAYELGKQIIYEDALNGTTL